MTSREDARARHRLRGRPRRGTAWLTEHSGQGRRGRHRYVRRPASGLMAISAVLLAASAASSGVGAGTDHPDADPSRNYRTGAGGNTPPRAAFPRDALTTAMASSAIVTSGPVAYTGSIPATVLDAYRRAQERTNLAQPNCHIPLELLAAIGKVETGHARGGRVDATGRTLGPILGPVLDGGAFAAIRDTDGGALDGDPSWDRAVGPMQFIPSTWARWAADGNVDGRTDPHNVYDASLAAARYLCAANRDLGTPEGLDSAILSYNHSTSYLSLVKSWMSVYRSGTLEVADIADPGTAPGAQAAGAPPGQPPVTPPATPPTTPVAPPTAPSAPPPASPPTTSPPGSPTPPPSSDPATPPPSDSPTTPPSQPPTDPATPPSSDPSPECEQTGLVGGLLGTVGGLLGAPQPDATCEQPN